MVLCGVQIAQGDRRGSESTKSNLLLCEARRSINRKARCGDDRGPAPQELHAALEADLHPAPGDQQHPTAQVARLDALREVELGAQRTKFVVEVVDLSEPSVAGVAGDGLVEHLGSLRSVGARLGVGIGVSVVVHSCC